MKVEEVGEADFSVGVYSDKEPELEEVEQT